MVIYCFITSSISVISRTGNSVIRNFAHPYGTSVIVSGLPSGFTGLRGGASAELFFIVHFGILMPLVVITTGASLGALHAANMFFRRPDLFAGTIAMSGVYDLTTYTKGYYDEDVYFNSPCHYLPNLSDEDTLNRLKGSGHLHILAGSGDYEDPDASRRLAGILASKGIGFDLDIWGHDIRHDWPTWRMMLPYVIDKKF